MTSGLLSIHTTRNVFKGFLAEVPADAGNRLQIGRYALAMQSVTASYDAGLDGTQSVANYVFSRQCYQPVFCDAETAIHFHEAYRGQDHVTPSASRHKSPENNSPIIAHLGSIHFQT